MQRLYCFDLRLRLDSFNSFRNQNYFLLGANISYNLVDTDSFSLSMPFMKSSQFLFLSLVIIELIIVLSQWIWFLQYKRGTERTLCSFGRKRRSKTKTKLTLSSSLSFKIVLFEFPKLVNITSLFILNVVGV